MLSPGGFDAHRLPNFRPERKEVLWLVDAVYLACSLRAHSHAESVPREAKPPRQHALTRRTAFLFHCISFIRTRRARHTPMLMYRPNVAEIRDEQ